MVGFFDKFIYLKILDCLQSKTNWNKQPLSLKRSSKVLDFCWKTPRSSKWKIIEWFYSKMIWKTLFLWIFTIPTFYLFLVKIKKMTAQRIDLQLLKGKRSSSIYSSKLKAYRPKLLFLTGKKKWLFRWQLGELLFK